MLTTDHRTRLSASAPLWAALVVSSLAWTLHLVIGYFLVESLCLPIHETGTGAPVREVWLPLVLLTAGAALLALASAAYAWLGRGRLPERGAGLSRAYGMTSVVVALSLFFLVLILLESLPLLIVGCGS